MLLRILTILAAVADAFAVFSMWGFGIDSPTWLKLLCTVAAVLLVLLAWRKERDAEIVNDYVWEDDDEYARLLIGKNDKFKDNSVAGVYIIRDEVPKLVALGYVIIEKGKPQIMVFKHIDDAAICAIKASTKRCKSYCVKPTIRYSDISSLNILV